MERRRELTNDAAKTTSWVTPDPGQLVRGLIPLCSVYWPQEDKHDQLLILLGVKVNISPAPTEQPVRPHVLWLRDV